MSRCKDPSCVADFRNVLEDQHVPKKGRYHNALVEDSANTRYYMYDACGVFTEIKIPESGASVTSVNGKVGVVVLNPDDLSDTLSVNKFISAAELAKLAGIEPGAEVNVVTSVNGMEGDVILNISNLVINVKDYGAVGDAIVDDTSAIQDAVDAAVTAGGGTIFFPRGTYKISSKIVLDSNISLEGVGGGQDNTKGSVIRMISTTEHAFYAEITDESVTAIRIQKLRIEGPSSGTGNGIYLKNTGDGGDHPPFTYCAFRDVFIAGFGAYGFNAESLIVSTLQNVVSETNGGGFFLNGAVDGGYTTLNTSVGFHSCYANGNTNDGFNLTSCTYVSLQSCAADSNGVGYRIFRCNAVSLTACGSEYGNPDTATPGDSYIIEDGSGQIGLYNCVSFQNASTAITVKDTSYGVTIIGFQENTPISATYAIDVEAGSIVTILSSDWTSATNFDGIVTTLEDGGGGMSVPGFAYYSGTFFADGPFRKSSFPPANASATGAIGQIEWDASYIYVCTATNTWKRVAIATW